MNRILAPSILSGDFKCLGEQLKITEEAGAQYIHFDVMDGMFVPSISFGMPVLASIRGVTGQVMDVHLMIDRPVRYVERFCQAGADIVTVHVEADTEENTRKALELIHGCGKRAAVSVKPKTPAEAVLPFLELCHIILVMTVEPGFGGQPFMESQLKTITRVREIIQAHNPSCDLEVDGGITPSTARRVVEAGANVLVAGSALYEAPDLSAAMAALRALE